MACDLLASVSYVRSLDVLLLEVGPWFSKLRIDQRQHSHMEETQREKQDSCDLAGGDIVIKTIAIISTVIVLFPENVNFSHIFYH